VEQIQLDPAFAASSAGAMLLTVRGRLRLLRGDHPAAVTDLRAAGTIWSTLQFRNPVFSVWRSPLALALSHQHRDEALALVTEELRNAEAIGLPRWWGVALRPAGLLEGGEPGIELLRESSRMLDQVDAPLERARTLVELGGALRRADRRVAARDPLRTGLELAERCGAERLAERAVEELRVCGARPRRRALSGPDALTPAEARVARMAAAGMKTRDIAQALFVTAKTVENQLGVTFHKLGVHGRADLAAALGIGQ
jgi:DNA-binding CsgD family transcriptional regulator